MENMHCVLAEIVALASDTEFAVNVAVPPQTVALAGIAATRPAGKLSVKPTPVSDDEAFGLVMVKVSVVLWPILIDAAPKFLRIDGGEGALTPTEAVAALPGSLSLEVTVLVVLFFAPAVLAVTFTENVQLAPAPSVAPVRDTFEPAAVAAIEPPPHDPVRPLGVATTSPEGKLSVKLTLVSDVGDVFGLLMVKDRLVLCPIVIDVVPNVLVNCGESAFTVITSVPLLPPAKLLSPS